MRTFARAIALSTVTVFALTGCVRVEMHLDLQADDSVNGEMVFAVTQEMLAMAGEDALDNAITGDQALESAVTERYESDETNADGEPMFVGTRTTFTGEPLSGFGAAGGDLSITRDGDDFVVSGRPEDGGGQAGDTDLPPDADVTLSVTFPGDVSSHNGDLDGSTVTWDLTTHEGAVEARGAASEGGFPTWLLIAVIALVGVGIGMAIVLVGATKRKPTDDSHQAEVTGLEGEFQGTVDTADAGAGTVAPEAEPVVPTDDVVDTTSHEDPTQP